jgi:FkbM family methyltransferase
MAASGQLRRRARRLAWKFGYDVRPFVPMRDPFLRLAAFCAQLEVSLVIDVGANRGLWVSDLREAGYQGRVASFEPDPSAHAALAARASADPAWTAYPIGLGASRGTVELRLTDDSHFNSFLPQGEPIEQTATRGVHLARVERLDEVLEVAPGERVFLKVDVQGYELPVLDGASGILDRVVGAQVEVNMIPLYEGQPSITQVISRLESDGLRVAGVINGSLYASGEESFFDLLAVRSA